MAVFLKVSYPDEPQGPHLISHEKCKYVAPPQTYLGLSAWGWGQAICYHALQAILMHWSLRTTHPRRALFILFILSLSLFIFFAM